MIRILFLVCVFNMCRGDFITKYLAPATDRPTTVAADFTTFGASDLTDSQKDNVVPTMEPLLEDKKNKLERLEGDRSILLSLERQMSNLRSELTQVMKKREQQIDFNVQMNQIKLEAENLRNDLRSTRQELWSLKATREKDQELLAKVKINEATTKWMKNSMTEFRKELKEISKSEENVTGTIYYRQKTESEILLLKSDLKSLLSKYQQLEAKYERDTAKIGQFQLEISNLRKENQDLAAKHLGQSIKIIEIEDDVSLLQSNNRATNQQLKSLQVHISENELLKLTHPKMQGSTVAPQHKLRHHGHMKREIVMLSNSINDVSAKQSALEKYVKNLEANISRVVMSKNDDIEKLVEVTSEHKVNVSSLSRKIDEMKGYLQNVETQNSKHSDGIQNLTEFTTSVYNLHDSTMQLFNSLEGIDLEMSSNIQELQKEVSKISYNVVQSHASIDVIKQDLISHTNDIQEIRSEMALKKSQQEKDHITITSIHNDILQLSLKKCKDDNTDLMQDLKIANAEAKIAKIESKHVTSNRELELAQMQLRNKVNQNTVDMWKKAYTDLNSRLQTASSEIQNLDDTYKRLDKEVSHFVYQLPHDCGMKVKNPNSNYNSGVYLIRPVGIPEAVEIFCDMESQEPKDRWTVIQRRYDGTENFFRDWNEYKEGFGNRNGEYWIGNRLLHHLTDQGNYTLRIEFWDKSGNYSYADYENFYVGNEADKFRLYIDEYSGNASDAMSYHNKQAFSTKDSDNDASSTHCAVYYSAGWWYTHCQYVNANGLYNTGLTWYNVETHEWIQLQKITLKIRQKD